MMNILSLIGLLLTAITSFPSASSTEVTRSSVPIHSMSSVSGDVYDVENNSTNIIWSNNAGLNITETPAVTCEVARIKCALRQGCGTALQSYMLDCSDLLNGRIEHCDEFCKASLIALTSTKEGENLMNCLCTDSFCKEAKRRLEVCREEVEQAHVHNAVVSCSVAHLICSADTSCSTALFYYDKFCRRMFSGRGCSFRCNNSISILERQKKAEKLSTCLCDGTEPFACQKIKTNMATLCFNHKDEKNVQKEEEETNQIDGGGADPSNKDDDGLGNRSGSHASRLSCGNSGLALQVVVFIWWLGCSYYGLGCYSVSIWLRPLFGLTSAAVVRWS